MELKVSDCRNFPSASGCSLTIAGTEDEVIRAAVEHAVSTHGHVDSPELREEIRKSLKPESIDRPRGGVRVA
jgi:predicted small metal-binding protein